MKRGRKIRSYVVRAHWEGVGMKKMKLKKKRKNNGRKSIPIYRSGLQQPEPQ